MSEREKIMAFEFDYSGPVMAFEFSYSGPPEYSVKVPGTNMMIYVSKAGGGTVGERYDGYWDTAVFAPWKPGRPAFTDKLEYAADGRRAMSTGMPKTHEEVARIRAEMSVDTDLRLAPAEWDALAVLAHEEGEE